MQNFKIKLKVFTLFFLSLLLLSGCAKRVKKTDSTQTANSSTTVPGQPGADSEVGPPLPPVPPQGTTAEPAPADVPPATPPATPESTAPGYVLVMGPGLAHTLSFIGVIKEFEKNAVPIRAVVAVEFSSVLASIWSHQNLNALEWQLYKFKTETLFDYPLIKFGAKTARGKKVLEYLKDVFGDADLKSFRVPVYVGSVIHSSEHDEVKFEKEGPAASILRGALGLDGFIQRHIENSLERSSASLDTPMPAQFAKSLEQGKVICLNALGTQWKPTNNTPLEGQVVSLMKTTSNLVKNQEKDCDAIINVNVSGLGFLDFASRADFIFQGREAAEKWLRTEGLLK